MAVLYLEIDRTSCAREWSEATGYDVEDYGASLVHRVLWTGEDEASLVSQMRQVSQGIDAEVTIRRQNGEVVL